MTKKIVLVSLFLLLLVAPCFGSTPSGLLLIIIHNTPTPIATQTKTKTVVFTPTWTAIANTPTRTVTRTFTRTTTPVTRVVHAVPVSLSQGTIVIKGLTEEDN